MNIIKKGCMLALVILIACSAAVGSVHAETATNTNKYQDFFDNNVEQVLEKYHIPGVAISVVEGDQVTFSKGYGLAKTNPRTPMTDESLVRIASISKLLLTPPSCSLWNKASLT